MIILNASDAVTYFTLWAFLNFYRLAVGDWILMSWSLIAALLVQVIWSAVFAKVKPSDCYLHMPDDSSTETEAERAAAAKETFELIGRLATYMLREWPFYILAFSCLFAYSLGKPLLPSTL